jgi:hypothetical protein
VVDAAVLPDPLGATVDAWSVGEPPPEPELPLQPASSAATATRCAAVDVGSRMPRA